MLNNLLFINRVAGRRSRYIPIAAALLAACFTVDSGAQPTSSPSVAPTIAASATTAPAPAQSPGTPSGISLPFTITTTRPSTPTTTAPASEPTFPFSLSPGKILEPTTLPAPPVPHGAEKPVRSSKPVIEGEATPGEPRPFGTTPEPTAETLRSYKVRVPKIHDPEVTLDIIVGKPRLLEFSAPPIKIQIPDEKIASYDIISPRELSVNGVTTGTTVLNIGFEDPTSPTGRTFLSYYVRVISDPETKIRIDKVYKSLEDTINKAFPDSHVQLTLVGRNLVVTGEAKDAKEANNIIRVLNSNIAGTSNLRAPVPGFVNTQNGADSNNPNNVDNPQEDSARQPAATDSLALANNGIAGAGGDDGGGRIQQKRTPNGGNSGGDSGFVINMLRVPGENQVMLKVIVAEVNRDAARSVGLNFTVSNSKLTPIFANLTGGLGTFNSGSQGGQFPMLLDKGQIGVTLEALRSITLAKSLAEPNLVTVNGQTAHFQSGGKFPVPVVTGQTSSGLQGVQFVPFGISMQFTPYITEKDNIRLVFNAEVSTRDATTGTSVGGASVSGIETRNVQTTVDLKAGQTLAVAGLIQTNYGSGSNRIPVIGELPYLANLLGESQSSTSEQELVILINAEMVRPMNNNVVPPLPGHDVFEASDVEFFLQGRLESKNGPDYRSARRTDWERLTRYQRLQRSFLFGEAGYSDGRTADDKPIERRPTGDTPADRS